MDKHQNNVFKDAVPQEKYINYATGLYTLFLLVKFFIVLSFLIGLVHSFSKVEIHSFILVKYEVNMWDILKSFILPGVLSASLD